MAPASVPQGMYHYKLTEFLHNSGDRVPGQAIEAPLAWLSATLRSATEGLILIDDHGNVASMNAAAEEMTGWRFDEAIGTSAHEVIRLSPYASDGAENAVSRAVDEQAGFATGEFLLQSKTTEATRLVHVRTAITRIAGEAAGWVVKIHEIATPEVLGLIHDLKNLMLVILAHAEILQKELPDSHAAGELHRLAAAAASLSHQLLTAKTRAAGKLSAIDLRVPVQSSAGLIRQILGPASQVVEDLPEQPLLVRFDRNRLEQMLFNLALNARDAMPKGGTLIIALRRKADSAELTFTDSGIGMDQATVAHMFDPFFTRNAGVRSGLGMATVRNAVLQADGRIEVESERGLGTVIRILLPLAAETGGAD